MDSEQAPNNTRIEVGVIELAEFGIVDFKERLLGVNFVIAGDGWRTSSGMQYTLLEHVDPDTSNNHFYQVELHERNVEALKSLSQLLKDANVYTIDKLIGKKVEVTFRDKAKDDPSAFIGMRFDSIRILD